MIDMPKTIADLILKHLNDELNDQERQNLDKWIQQSEDNERFFRKFTNEDDLAATITEYETSKGIVFNKIKEAIPFNTQQTSNRVITGWFKWKRLTAAASILLIGSALILWGIGNKNNEQVVQVKSETPVTTDRQPASDGAILKLADGKEIVLDDAKDGAVATQGNTAITKQGGQLAYKSRDAGNKVLYNTLLTPKGKIYKLLLPDGSKVWLNAASSIRFPTAFVDGQRNVEVTGEVYFEVEKNAEMPFHVSVNHQASIEVLGTMFNVNAYENEGSIRTTLLEGSIKMEQQAGNGVVLQPGQQAQLMQTTITVAYNVNIPKVMGWKNGYFSLDDITLQELMREIERWYDVEVVYEKDIPKKTLFGKVNRDISLLDFMDGLKDWGVRFRLEGKKLIITGVL
jgi:Fe2+-dicitrate sensor, membrane component